MNTSVWGSGSGGIALGTRPRAPKLSLYCFNSVVKYYLFVLFLWLVNFFFRDILGALNMPKSLELCQGSL